MQPYREIQNLMKEIVRRAMLDKDYRELCLKDSRAAIQALAEKGIKIPYDIVFLEEEQEQTPEQGLVYVLPPFLKPSWLTSKRGEEL